MKANLMVYKCIFLILCFQSMHLHVLSQQASKKVADKITLPDVNEHNISLTSLKGKVVLIDFWASWCRPCRQTVPGLKKLYGLYHDKGFEIYGISLDEDKIAWKTAIQEDQSTWIHVNDKTGNVANQWQISVIPTSFLLNKDGKIVAVDEDAKSLSKLIPKLL